MGRAWGRVSGGGGRAGKVIRVDEEPSVDAFWLIGAFLSLEMAAWKGSYCVWERVVVGRLLLLLVASIETADGRLDGAFRKTWSKPVLLLPMCWFWVGISDEILACALLILKNEREDRRKGSVKENQKAERSYGMDVVADFWGDWLGREIGRAHV